MHVTKAKLVTILTERVFETALIGLIEEAGASGYSIEDAGRGRGRHGRRAGVVESEGMIKIVIVVSPQIATGILQALSRRFIAEQGIKVLVQDAEVMNWSLTPVS